MGNYKKATPTEIATGLTPLAMTGREKRRFPRHSVPRNDTTICHYEPYPFCHCDRSAAISKCKGPHNKMKAEQSEIVIIHLSGGGR